jgi:hypothetical protein
VDHLNLDRPVLGYWWAVAAASQQVNLLLGDFSEGD